MLTLKTRADLEKLVQSREPESLLLEYKRCAALLNKDGARNELVKDVSAFANSAGGQIIYGITDDANQPASLDEGISKSEVTPEAIESVLSSRITPRIQGIVIDQIPLSADKFAYVINIPQSMILAPHQSLADHKYYRRHNFISMPMADYEIREAMQRAAKPELQAFVHIGVGMTGPNFTTIEMFVTLANLASAPALYCGVVVDFEPDCPVVNKTFVRMGTRNEYQHFSQNFGLPNHSPIFKEMDVRQGPSCDFEIRLNPNISAAYNFRIKVAAPGYEREEEGEVGMSNGKPRLIFPLRPRA